MNYEQTYYTLMLKGKQREISNPLTGYKEWHHIDPKSRGGTDDNFNLVCLTPEEHFLAHKLLVKMYPGEEKLVMALSMMTVDNGGTDRSKNKAYGWVRREINEMNSARGKRPGAFIPSFAGKRHSEETKRKMSKARDGIVISEESREKIAHTLTGRKHSEKSRKKMSASRKGKQHSPSHVASRVASATKTKRTNAIEKMVAQLLELSANK